MIYLAGKTANEVKRDYLKRHKPKKAPGAGSRHVPVRHIELVEMIEEAMLRNSWKIGRSKFFLTGNGMGLAASWEFSGVGTRTGDPFAIQSLGIVTSNDRSRQLRLWPGTVLTGSNTAFVLDEFIIGKHSTGIDLKSGIEEAFDYCREKAAKMPISIDKFKKTGFACGEWNEFILLVARMGILPWSRIGVADRLHTGLGVLDECCGVKRTKWRALHALAVAAAHGPTMEQLPTLAKLRSMVEKEEPDDE
jgi:hypothetical protein